MTPIFDIRIDIIHNIFKRSLIAYYMFMIPWLPHRLYLLLLLLLL